MKSSGTVAKFSSSVAIFLKQLEPQHIAMFLYFVCMPIFLSILLTPQFMLILPTWYLVGGYLYFKSRSVDRKLSNYILALSIIYPYIEVLIKLFVLGNLIPYSWFVINRIEHGIASAVMTWMLYLLVRLHKITTRHIAVDALIVVGALNILGLANEFVEFIIRLGVVNNIINIGVLDPNTVSGSIGMIYYEDTIYDLMINLVASIIAFLIAVYGGRFLTSKKKYS